MPRKQSKRYELDIKLSSWYRRADTPGSPFVQTQYSWTIFDVTDLDTLEVTLGEALGNDERVCIHRYTGKAAAFLSVKQELSDDHPIVVAIGKVVEASR